MKSFFSKLTLSACMAAASLLAVGTASAEDKAKWTGLYTGATLGYSIVDQGFSFGEDDEYKYKSKGYRYKEVYKTDNDADGFAGGAHIGYNHQTGKLVFGIEGDFSKTTSDIGYKYKEVERWRHRNHWHKDKYKESLNMEIDYLASLRARLGFAHQNAMFYVTGGVAWTKIDWDWKAKAKYDGYTYYKDGASGSDNLTGYVLGGGAEYMIADGFSLRGEVLHYEFDDKGYDLDSTVARVGFSMKIN